MLSFVYLNIFLHITVVPRNGSYIIGQIKDSQSSMQWINSRETHSRTETVNDRRKSTSPFHFMLTFLASKI